MFHAARKSNQSTSFVTREARLTVTLMSSTRTLPLHLVLTRWLPLIRPAGLPIYVARFPSAPLIDSRPRSSTLSRFPVYPSRLPPDVFPPGTITRKTKAGNQKPELNQNAIHVSCGNFLTSDFRLGSPRTANSIEIAVMCVALFDPEIRQWLDIIAAR